MKTMKLPLWGLGVIAILFTACNKDDNDDNPDPNTTTRAVYTSSNTSGEISKHEFENDESSSADVETYTVAYSDADGIEYDSQNDVLYHADRTNSQLNAYADISAQSGGATLDADFASSLTGSFVNARGITKSGNRIVVAQQVNAGLGAVNSFFVYDVSSNSLSLSAVLAADIDLWGIHADGSTMYAINDNTNSLAVYNDFFSNTTGTVEADMEVAIEGITRTHGITYDASSDVMILTDIGDAGDDSDGAIHIITDFSSKLDAAGDGGTIAASEQVRISGSNTMLGNPVDVAYDASTRQIFVAERANGGGRLLVFNSVDANANSNPVYNAQVSGISSVTYAE